MSIAQADVSAFRYNLHDEDGNGAGMTDELIGKRIGGYEVIGVLGRGGMATVYRAHQVSMNRVVALKVLPRQFLTDDTYMQRFEREVAIVSRLEHRSIVPVYDYGEQDGQPFIAMRYMAGGSVDDLLRHGSLSEAKITEILAQIAPALDYAHSKNVLHRDLKPSNVLLDDAGGAFLTDFGIARLLGEQHGGTLTATGVVGTPSYMSPEQAQGKPLDARSDLYGLGVMIYEMATGRRPFEGDTPYGIAVQQVTATPPPPRTFQPSLSPALEKVILRSLEKAPDHRYPNAAALADAVALAFQPPAASLHDTQPGLPRPEVEATVPVTPPPLTPPAPDAAAPAIPLPPVYLTPPPYENAPVTGAPLTGPVGGSSVGLRPVTARRKKRGLGWLSSALIGGGVGCVLLLVLVAALLIGGLLLLQRDRQLVSADATATAASRQAATRTAASDAANSGLIPTLDTAALPTLPAAAALPADDSAAVRLIVYADRGGTRGGNFDLYALPGFTEDAAADAAETRLTTSSAADIMPSIAPDGTQIAFISDRDGDFDLYVLDRAQGRLDQLTDNTVTDRAPAWSPDGAWIVFSTDEGGGAHALYRIRPDGSDLERVFGDDRRASDPTYTPDGRFLLFTYGVPSDPSTFEIARLDLVNGEVTRLTANGQRDWAPIMLPDGGILYTTDGDGHAAIARLTAAGETEILYDSPGYDWGGVPVLLADDTPPGYAIVFTSDVSGRDQVYRLQLTADGVSEADPIALTTQGGMTGR